MYSDGAFKNNAKRNRILGKRGLESSFFEQSSINIFDPFTVSPIIQLTGFNKGIFILPYYVYCVHKGFKTHVCLFDRLFKQGSFDGGLIHVCLNTFESYLYRQNKKQKKQKTENM